MSRQSSTDHELFSAQQLAAARPGYALLFVLAPRHGLPEPKRWTTCAMHSRIISLLGLLVLIIVGFAAAGQGPGERSIDGKRLSVWLDEFQKSIPKPEYDGDPGMRARA